MEIGALDVQVRHLREQRRRLVEHASARWRTWWCAAVWGIACGASIDALVSLAGEKRGFELAVVMCVVAGAATLGLVAPGRR